ncbi:MAG: tetratricopeptide repeat protein [Paracoccaceae bacterium]|nr:tetratricopeptide repeat protein [Paracoccaceae bacterium]
MRFFKTLGHKDASAQALITRGDAARDRRAWAKAAKAYKAALDADPDLPNIWVQYGHVLKENDQVSDAVDAYREALQRRPGHAETQVHLAHVLKRLALYQDAMEAFEEALILDSSDEESAQELFSLQRRLNVVPETPRSNETAADPGLVQAQDEERSPDHTAPSSQKDLETQAILLKEREASAANELRLSALQTFHADVQAENDALKEQVKGQQAEIENQRTEHEERLKTDAVARDGLLEAMETLKQKIKDQRAEIEALRHMEESLEALKSQMRDYDLRTDLAKKEFIRSEGQIALIKDMFLREGEL